jgi:hypothetical protein
MNIIEAIGITPGLPKTIDSVGDCYRVYEAAGLKKPSIAELDFDDAVLLKKHLDEKNEMLEALIEIIEGGYFHEKNTQRYFEKIVEKATGKPFEVIKQLYEEGRE